MTWTQLVQATMTALVVCSSIALWPQTLPLNQRVLVVYNSDLKESKKVAEYYMARRGIPVGNQCAIRPNIFIRGPWSEISVNEYLRNEQAQIRKCLSRVGKTKILYIVQTYATPYQLKGMPQNSGLAVDQRLADIWNEAPQAGMEANPYYGGGSAKTNMYPPFVSFAQFRDRPNAPTIYSVWRLDADTPELARGLVDKAMYAEQRGLKGRACFDLRTPEVEKLDESGYSAGEWWLHRAAAFARQAHLSVIEDTKPEEFSSPGNRCDNAILYSGWYSLNNYNDAFTWAVGAIGWHLDSASAQNPRGGANWSANALKRGITVTAGAVGEPFLTGLPRPDLIVHDLLQGANVGDSFLRGTPWLGWMIIYIGDPLYRPFAHPALPFP